MKTVTFILLSVLIGLAVAEEPEAPLAEECNKELCKLPKCRCSSTDIPGELAPRDTPQFITLTFDDGVNIRNIETYREILYQRTNKNNCPASATFFVNHEYTDYQLVNELYNQGFEIALHSISHQTPQSYWAEATYENMMKEFGDQKRQMSHFANIPSDAIQGIRIPFLQMTGNASFQVMAATGLRYDSTWPTTSFTDPGLWPYTLDYASTQDCIVPPCPTASVPGVWVLPMISWRDLNGFPCSMVDACVFVPPHHDEEAWFKFILTNFERHYLGNRAPFGFYIHEWYISAYPGVKRALVRFLDLVNSLNDAFMVSAGEVIDWVENPVPVNEYVKKECKSFVSTSCRRTSCGPLTSTHTEMSYWMQICNICPRVYPWLENPLGE
ncbi:chitin deacetylase 8 [Papilio machaon]|uniref:chitin deacetylase 8 n=1 Tax=Papilio machaon TaxID=76193 RepID=UPI001E664A3F|nr:chitin deacetylase 8 [Papilio machaon]